MFISITHAHSQTDTHPRLLSVRPYSQPLRGSWTRTVTSSPLFNARRFGLDEGWDTKALMDLPTPKPRQSPTELERDRLGRGDGAGHTIDGIKKPFVLNASSDNIVRLQR